MTPRFRSNAHGSEEPRRIDRLARELVRPIRALDLSAVARLSARLLGRWIALHLHLSRLVEGRRDQPRRHGDQAKAEHQHNDGDPVRVSQFSMMNFKLMCHMSFLSGI